jgi:DNA modification methylase
LRPWKGNPRANADAVEPVARSISRFGFGAPILAREADREVIAGHTRLLAVEFLRTRIWDDEREAFRSRRDSDGPFVAPGAPGPGLVPVRLLDLDEQEAHALALADNRLGELASWDEASLERELRALREQAVSLDGLGWSQTDLAGLLAELSPEAAPTTSGPSGVASPVGPARVLVGRCEDRLREVESESLDACVCDPPYGLSDPPDPAEVLRAWLDGRAYVHPRPGFMGHEWDAFVPGPEVWREVFRVLKPGAHVVAFAGSRTVDWMSLALRLAGFEIRDTASWVHFTGFPKNVDATRAIDRLRNDRDRVYTVTEWLADRCAEGGISPRDLDEMFGTDSMGSHWLKRRPGLQPQSPGVERFSQICARLGIEPDPEIADLVVLIESERSEPGEAFAERPVIGAMMAVDTTKKSLVETTTRNPKRRIARTAAGSEAAAPWAGWGTALRPLVEPWVLARKPFGREGGREVSLGVNLLRHNVGAINIDGCRFVDGDPMWVGPHGGPLVRTARKRDDNAVLGKGLGFGRQTEPTGRWPANIVACSKPSRVEREAGLDGFPEGPSGLRNGHPTLKPIRLMAWLARLVTPMGGTVLDPFAGSGTVGCAALPQGFGYLGIEIDPTHAAVAEARIAHWAREGLGALPEGEQDEP